MILSEFKRSVTEIKGIGASKKAILEKTGIRTVADLLLWFPRRWEDRTQQIPFSAVITKGTATTTAKVMSHQYFFANNKRVLKVIVTDSTGVAELVCFGRNFLERQLPVGATILITGIFERRFTSLQSSQFQFEDINKGDIQSAFNRILPIYPLSSNLTQAFFRKIIYNALLAFGKTIDDDLPSVIRKEYDLLHIQETLSFLHLPPSQESLDQAIISLKFRELYHFYEQANRQKMERLSISLPTLAKDTTLQNKYIESLPYTLTPDQIQVITEINDDLFKPHPMGRLLQGDVGSGKTVVATASALPIISNKKQVAFLVPTELLASQHAEKLAKELIPLGLRIALLTGSLSAAARRPLLTALKEGEIDLIIGTHALFTSTVQFHDLGLVIIDEQHKFGVNQREAMRSKGYHPHTLLLSATPIPRTLAQTLYADLGISEIQSRPSGRLPIKTHLAYQKNREKVFEQVIAQLEKGHQAYFVYPRIAKDDDLVDVDSDIFESSSEEIILDASESFKNFSKTHFSKYKTALLHSESPEDEKETTMKDFNSGKIDILFATTIIEVGIDNPNATIILVENANRFGLAQLHQLRGRVGRGSSQSYCFLVYPETISEEGGKRLMALKNSNDGFFIAQEDLKIRGPGELLGSRQSGQFPLQLANPLEDKTLLEKVLSALDLN